MSGFKANIYVSEQLSNQLVNVSQELVRRCIMECALRYDFDGEEALLWLNLNDMKMESKGVSKSVKNKPVKAEAPKAAFPLPYNGELNEQCCFALRQNNGLYTQCTGVRKGEAKFCKSCATILQKTGCEVPEYGTIQDRQAVGIFDFVDPKGRKPVSYTKVMKKYKLTEEQVMEEAGKLNIKINPEHFVAVEDGVKRGRPSIKKEVKEKGSKGRPKKSKKVIEIEGDEEDLFASLIAQANEEEEMEPSELVKVSSPKVKKVKSEEEKEAKKLEAEKAKAEKEAKKEAGRLEREAKKKAEEDAKAAKKAAIEEAKKEKEEAKKSESKKSEAKKSESKKSEANKAVVEEQDEEQDVVKKIEYEGKKYLKSKKTGIIYDYNEYTKNGEQVVVGKWNDTSNKIDFNEEKDDDEEEEEDYDM